MRAPRPTLPNKAEAVRVILDALTQRELQEQRAMNSAENIARIRKFLAGAKRTERRAERAAEAIYQSVRRRLRTLPPQDRARVAARLNDEFRIPGKPGRPRSGQHVFNWHVARQLPFFMQVLSARYPTVQITKEWTIKVVCVAFPELKEISLRNHFSGRHRPRRP